MWWKRVQGIFCCCVGDATIMIDPPDNSYRARRKTRLPPSASLERKGITITRLAPSPLGLLLFLLGLLGQLLLLLLELRDALRRLLRGLERRPAAVGHG